MAQHISAEIFDSNMRKEKATHARSTVATYVTCTERMARHDGQRLTHVHNVQRRGIHTGEYVACSVGIAGGGGGSTPFNVLVALVYLSWGSDVTPVDRKNVKNANFSCHSCQYMDFF